MAKLTIHLYVPNESICCTPHVEKLVYSMFNGYREQTHWLLASASSIVLIEPHVEYVYKSRTLSHGFRPRGLR